MNAGDLTVLVSAEPEVLTTGTLWFGSAHISGMVDGKRFSAAYDFSHLSFATEQEAKRYAEERARQRIVAGLFPGLAPRTDTSNSPPAVLD